MTCKFLSLDEYVEHRDLTLSYYERIDNEGFSNVMNELFNKLYNYPLEKG